MNKRHEPGAGDWKGHVVKRLICRARDHFQTVLRTMEKINWNEAMSQGDEGGVFLRSCPDFNLGGHLFGPGPGRPMLHANWGQELGVLDLTLPRPRDMVLGATSCLWDLTSSSERAI